MPSRTAHFVQAPSRILKPLCVDLDGTLVAADTLFECWFSLARTNPWLFLIAPFWLLRGKAHLKARLAKAASLNVRILPFHGEFVKYLEAEHASGRKLVLVTAADQQIASAIASHLGFFSSVLASNGKVNLSGARKALALKQLYGSGGFIYAGNSSVDLPVWECAGEAILVNTPNSVRASLDRQHITVRQQFGGKVHPFSALLSTLRTYQWLKNLLLLVPFFAAHRKPDLASFANLAAAFGAFCFCASIGYVVNDLLDVEADRLHVHKRRRPFASGAMPLAAGLCLIPVLLILSAALAWHLPPSFRLLLVLYLAATLVYSLVLKRLPLVDVIALAGLYTIRVGAGAAAVSVSISPWLLGLSIFLFVSLALAKRVSELSLVERNKGELNSRRGYRAEDRAQLASFGTSSGYMAVLVLALYVNSPETSTLYWHPMWLLAICPLLIYWVSRIWLLAHRGEMHEDALLFALRDHASYIVGLLVGVATVLAL